MSVNIHVTLNVGPQLSKQTQQSVEIFQRSARLHIDANDACCDVTMMSRRCQTIHSFRLDIRRHRDRFCRVETSCSW